MAVRKWALAGGPDAGTRASSTGVAHRGVPLATPAPGTREIQFDFKRIIDETNELERLSANFLTTTARERVRRFVGQLKNYRRSVSTTSRVYSWAIPEDAPWCTMVSDGAYETRDAGGEHRVYAAIDGVWRIYALPPTRASQEPETFSVEGPASIRVRLLERASGNLAEPTGVDPSERCLALWRIELGNWDAPGCHFHVQVLGQEREGPFPKSLSVPRLPSVFVTPAAAVEFVIAELFQQRWPRHVSERASSFGRWRALQRARWDALLRWQLERVHDPDFSSPWTALKAAKPPAGLFMEHPPAATSERGRRERS